MGINHILEEDLKQIQNNPYVKSATYRYINYTQEFKELFMIDYSNGITPKQIFIKYGFDVNVIGNKRIQCFTTRVKNQSKRIEGFKDTRVANSGRPKTKGLSQEEIIQQLKLKLEHLKQENDFLKRVRYLKNLSSKMK